MNIETVVAIFAAGFGLVSAVFAADQAQSARESKDEAKRQADSAKTQADAAVEANRIAGQALAIMQADAQRSAEEDASKRVPSVRFSQGMALRGETTLLLNNQTAHEMDVLDIRVQHPTIDIKLRNKRLRPHELGGVARFEPYSSGIFINTGIFANNSIVFTDDNQYEVTADVKWRGQIYEISTSFILSNQGRQVITDQTKIMLDGQLVSTPNNL